MKNEITNTGKPVLQSGEQAPVDKASRSATQDKAVSIRRRNLLKGLGAAPLVVTLHSGAAMAAQSNDCIGIIQGDPPKNCTAMGEDNYLRIEVDASGKVGQGSNKETHVLYQDYGSKDENMCLVSVDANGDIQFTENSYEPGSLSTNSCWASFA